uniref:Proteinase inhibitor n=1 Tax=Cruziohyla calcarifer TaxID=318249 RepID=A0A1W2KE27_CRUCA|nr:proteinase inhibitor precursor [Cruziohyla calcarifer]
MKTLISSALLFCILAAALLPVLEAGGVVLLDCRPYGPVCSKIFDPVCGTNFITYDNTCELCKAQRENPRISMRTKGKC